ncbi:hypothetical protein NXC24_CH01876 [Rhizobium sp. NXC24]|nr:hypothetical protein NXC24_CH01876 [Rhizobium sp. NXC24]
MIAPRLEVRGTYADALLRSTHKIAVTTTYNAFPHVEVVKAACVDAQIGKISIGSRVFLREKSKDWSF